MCLLRSRIHAARKGVHNETRLQQMPWFVRIGKERMAGSGRHPYSPAQVPGVPGALPDAGDRDRIVVFRGILRAHCDCDDVRCVASLCSVRIHLAGFQLRTEALGGRAVRTLRPVQSRVAMLDEMPARQFHNQWSPATRSRWVLLALIFAGILISYIDRGSLSIGAAAIMRDFRLPAASMGVLLSAFFWTYGAFQIPAGFLVDRFGIRGTYAAAFLIWSFASAGMALSRGAGDILSARLVLGFAETVGPVASLAFIRQHFSGPEQGLPLSIYIAGQTFGPACGALLGSALLVDFGWRAMFAVTGIAALLWSPAWLHFAPRKLPEPHRPAEAPKIPWPWQLVLSSPAVWAMSGCVFFFSYYWYFVLTWMPTYLTTARGFSTMQMGEILSVPLFSMAGVNIAAGWLADKFAARTGKVIQIRLWFAAAGLLGSSFVLFLNVIPDRAFVLPVLVVSICAFGIASSSYWAIAQFVPPVSMVGRTIGYLNTVSQIGGIAAPLITGWSLGPEKHFGLAILLAGLSPWIACLLLFIAGPHGLTKLKENLGNTWTAKIITTD